MTIGCSGARFPGPHPRNARCSGAGRRAASAAHAAIKRRPDRPYVLGMWCNQTQGAWSFPHEAADQLLGVYAALAGDWDGLVRRGIFLFPLRWGEGPVGTVGGEDIFQIAEVVNGSPHIYGLWPHAASLFLRGSQTQPDNDRRPARPPSRPAAKTKFRSTSAWDHARGRLVLDTPYTQGIAGWVGRDQPRSLTSTSRPKTHSRCWSPPRSVTSRSLPQSGYWSPPSLASSRLGSAGWIAGSAKSPTRAGPPSFRNPSPAKVVWRHKGKVTGLRPG